MVFQIASAAILGALFTMKVYWRRVKARVKGLFRKSADDEDDVDRRVLPGSFRDPSGFLFLLDSVLYRQINDSYFPTYDQLIKSGLYKALTETGLLIRHEEASSAPPAMPHLAGSSGQIACRSSPIRTNGASAS